MRQIPLTSYPNQTFRVTLAGQACEFSFRMGFLSQVWEFDLSVAGKAPIKGARFVLGTDLLRAFDLGIGALIAVALSEPGVEAARADLGDRVILTHYTPDEVEAIETAA